jgi:hypothetical protein
MMEILRILPYRLLLIPASRMKNRQIMVIQWIRLINNEALMGNND